MSNNTEDLNIEVSSVVWWANQKQEPKPLNVDINWNLKTTPWDSVWVDAFWRSRVSNPVVIFENKNIHTRNETLWEEPITWVIIEHWAITSWPFQVWDIITWWTSWTIWAVTAVNAWSLTITVNHNDFEIWETITGSVSWASADVTTIDTGSHIFHTRDEAAVTLQVWQNNWDKTIRQTHRFFPYRPWGSQLIKSTWFFWNAVENVRRRYWYFDNNNWLYIEQTLAWIRIALRSSTSWSPVNTEVEQVNWDDKLDGKWRSLVAIDFTKRFFNSIDFAWLWDGRIRFQILFNWKYIIFHEMNVSNTDIIPFMSTPSLPMRYEIENTWATTWTNIMKEFCCAVENEWWKANTWLWFSEGNRVTARSVTTREPIFAIRLKNEYWWGENRKTVQFSNTGFFTTSNGAYFEIVHLHDPISITGSWNPVWHNSAVEFSTNISAILWRDKQENEIMKIYFHEIN